MFRFSLSCPEQNTVGPQVLNKYTDLSQWSSNMHQNHLEGLVKHRFLSSTQADDLVVLRLGLKIQFSNLLLSYAGIWN